MTLCTEYLVDFIKWARESPAQVKWISEQLYGKLIYTISIPTFANSYVNNRK